MGAENEEMNCPSCGATISASSLTCGSCGINVRTGEVYEVKVERAKGREPLPERFGAGIGTGLALAFGLVLLSGFLYQRRMEMVIKERLEDFRHDVVRMELVDSLAAAGEITEARALGQELMADLTARADRIKVEAASGTRPKGGEQKRSRGIRRAEKKLLLNLAKKVQYKLDHLPAGPQASASAPTS